MRVSRSGTRKGGTYETSPGRGSAVRSGRPPFAERLEAVARDAASAEVESDLALVDELGQRLQQSPTPENLAAFRQAVHAVLSKVLQEAYTVEEMHSFSRQGRRRVQVLVRVVDEQLDQLAHMVLAKAKQTLAIARAIDEIKGLLLDAVR